MGEIGKPGTCTWKLQMSILLVYPLYPILCQYFLKISMYVENNRRNNFWKFHVSSYKNWMKTK